MPTLQMGNLPVKFYFVYLVGNTSLASSECEQYHLGLGLEECEVVCCCASNTGILAWPRIYLGIVQYLKL